MAAVPSRVTTLLNSRPIGGLQYRAFALAGLCVFMDGYGSQALAYIVPILARRWAVPPGAFGPVFAAGLLGSALGSLVLAPLADRFGRKRVMVAGALALGLFDLWCAAASSPGALECLIFLAGLGIGAALPNAIALVAEYAPERRRATVVTAVCAGLALGAAAGAVTATLLVARFGWAVVFVVGGAGSLLLALVLLGFLPESLAYLVTSGSKNERTCVLLRELIGPSLAERIVLIPEPQTRAASAAAMLFRDGRWVITVIYGLLAFLTLLTLYLLVSWLPTLIHSLGFSLSEASWSTAGFQLGGIAGVIALGILADAWDPVSVVLAAYVGAAASIAAISLATFPLGVALAAFGAGFTLIGAQACNNAMLASLYPTAARGTALGWNLTIGRVGSILGPAITGFLLLLRMAPRDVLLLAAMPAVCAAALLGAARGAIERKSDIG